MGKKWDYDVPAVDVWREALRILKPGGHLLAFAGTRTQHRMAVRIEDAGFEIRDMIAWVYGCLDEQTEIATSKGVKPYHKTRIGDSVLCYNPENGEYDYQPILEIVEYDYSDTAYRLVGDFGEQVVSRNHRVIVERCGKEVFQFAETLGAETCVPVLESLPALQQALHDAQPGSGCTQQNVQQGVLERADRHCERGVGADGESQRSGCEMRGVRCASLEAGRLVAQGANADLQPTMQWGVTGGAVGATRRNGPGALGTAVRGGIENADDGRNEPVLERRTDVSQPQGCLREPADQIRQMPGASNSHGAQRRVCDGTPSCGCSADRTTADSGRGCASHRPRCNKQQTDESDAVCDERTTQSIRAWGGHKTAVVRVVPFHYTGKVWCLRVPTGSFVAVRNGLAFPTGNSGFPKSLDVSKAIAPATESASQWQGWGTALKPALEPITVARKPLIGTVAANVLAHGTGALNIDGCRVAHDDGLLLGAGNSGSVTCG